MCMECGEVQSIQLRSDLEIELDSGLDSIRPDQQIHIACYMIRDHAR